MNDDRIVITGRKPPAMGGGNSTLIIRRVGMQIEITISGVWECGVLLSLDQVDQLRDALTQR